MMQPADSLPIAAEADEGTSKAFFGDTSGLAGESARSREIGRAAARTGYEIEAPG